MMLAIGLLLFPLSLFATAQSTRSTATVYDYIVVGSGPGGGPLAANLAKNGYSVLLLEAGVDRGDQLSQQVLGFSAEAQNDPAQRWDFFVRHFEDLNRTLQYQHLTWRNTDGTFYVGTDPPAGATMLGVYYPRAGTLGGCSTHNAGVAVLPSDSDWEHIANITGDSSWSPALMRQHFEKLEHNNYLPKGTPGHGFNGYLGINLANASGFPSQQQFYELTQSVAAKFGDNPKSTLDLLEKDLNNLSPTRDHDVGLWGLPEHIDAMWRRSDSRTYIKTVEDAVNADGSKKYPLTVQLNSLVTKVLFDNSKKSATGPRAVGVEYLLGESMYSADPRYDPKVTGTRATVQARKEVIISGGVFNSPQILKLSGIGPKAELKKFNIPVVVDLPGVGTNLQDNYEIGAISLASQNFTDSAPGPVCTFGAPGDPCLALWENGTGPYTNGVVPTIMLKTPHSTDGERDIHIFTIPSFAFRGYWPPTNQTFVDPPNTIDFSMVKIHSQNRAGVITLRSADPRDVPDINFNFFQDGADADVGAMEDAIAWAREVMNAIPAPLGPFTHTEPPPCHKRSGCSEKEYIINQAWSHHATSTCAIGADNDKMAVLDSKFRVRGVTGLRVVDGSAFPRTPGSFPVVPTFMLSEKATQAILADAKKH